MADSRRLLCNMKHCHRCISLWRIQILFIYVFHAWYLRFQTEFWVGDNTLSSSVWMMHCWCEMHWFLLVFRIMCSTNKCFPLLPKPVVSKKQSTGLSSYDGHFSWYEKHLLWSLRISLRPFLVCIMAISITTVVNTERLQLFTYWMSSKLMNSYCDIACTTVPM